MDAPSLIVDQSMVPFITVSSHPIHAS